MIYNGHAFTVIDDSTRACMDCGSASVGDHSGGVGVAVTVVVLVLLIVLAVLVLTVVVVVPV